MPIEQFKLIILGSKNASKVEAVQQYFPNVSINTVELENLSDFVPSQPFSDEETMKGCKLRAKMAFEYHMNECGSDLNRDQLNQANPKQSIHNEQFVKLDRHSEPSVLGIGIEGGICHIEKEYFQTTWCCVYDGTHFGFGSSSRFALPTQVVKDVNRGSKELASVMEFQSQEEKKKGSIWRYSQGAITRTDLNYESLRMAIIHLNWKRNVES